MHFTTLILLSLLASVQNAAYLRNTCFGAIPAEPHGGIGCGRPPFVEKNDYGDNENSKGFLRAWPRQNSFDIRIILRNLSRSDHVMTAWIVYTLPFLPKPDVFMYASIAAPLVPTTAAFTTGMGREPNQFKYTDATTAVLRVKLNYNPTYANEGPLARDPFCYQSDIPGIQKTKFRQYPLNAQGRFSPTTSHFLRKYDPVTGWEIREKGLPVIVRCPLKPFGIAVANHIDRTTHGISQGVLGVDHYEIMSFSLKDEVIGNPIVSKVSS